MKRLLILILALTLMLYAVPAPAEQAVYEIFDRGLTAYSGGDYATALEAFTVCVEQDLTEAYHCLAILYLYGLGVEQSIPTAAEYLKVSADRGLVDSQYLLGFIYMESNVKKTRKLGVEYLQKAAEQGSAEAQKRLDEIPQEGTEAYLEQLRKEAADAGLELPEPGEGERLYLGVAQVPDTWITEIYVFLIASPNLRNIRYLTLYGYALEVPREGDDPYLINSRSSFNQEEWLPLDMQAEVINFHFSNEMNTGISALVLNETGGSCIASMKDTYVNEEKNVNGVFDASASVTLYNLSGETAMNPVDPPTLQQLRNANMKLPEAGEGEALFIGRANVSQAGAFYIAFVRTADGNGIKNLTYLFKDLKVEYKAGNSRITQSSSDLSASFSGSFEVKEEIAAGSLRLTRFAMDGDTASCTVCFTYHDDKYDVDYPLDPAQVRFVKAE